MNTKVHAVGDGLGNPLRFTVFGGNRKDNCLAQSILEAFDLKEASPLPIKGMTATSRRGGLKNKVAFLCGVSLS